jgi:hypothetical protein
MPTMKSREVAVLPSYPLAGRLPERPAWTTTTLTDPLEIALALADNYLVSWAARFRHHMAFS